MNPIARLEMANGDIMRIELYPGIAPITVENFSTLVKKGFYDGLTFHRVIKNFMVQGGCPTGTGMGGPGHQIKGEFRANGVQNDLSHTTGVISMARSQAMNSAGSQFFIMHNDSPHLNGSYAGFGKVIEGLDIVEKMGNVATNFNDKPLEPLIIKQITMEENA